MKEVREKWKIVNSLVMIGICVFFCIGVLFGPCQDMPILIKAIFSIIILHPLTTLIPRVLEEIRQEKEDKIVEQMWEHTNLLINFRIWNWAEKCGFTNAQLKRNKQGYYVRLTGIDSQGVKIEISMPIDPFIWYKPWAEIVALLLSAVGMFSLLIVKITVYELGITETLFSSVSLRYETEEQDTYEMVMMIKREANSFSFSISQSELTKYLKFR